MESEDWQNYLIQAGISANSSQICAATFANEKLIKETLQMMELDLMLKKMRITAIGEEPCLLKQEQYSTNQ